MGETIEAPDKRICNCLCRREGEHSSNPVNINARVYSDKAASRVQIRAVGNPCEEDTGGKTNTEQEHRSRQSAENVEGFSRLGRLLTSNATQESGRR